MSRFSIAISLAAIGLATLLAGGAPSKNLLVNPGFESGGFAGWHSYGSWYVRQNVHAGHSGKYAAINTLAAAPPGITKTRWAGIYQNIPISRVDSGAFDASAWISTAAASNSEKAYLQVQFQNSSGHSIAQFTTPPISAGRCYKEARLRLLVAPLGTATVQVQGVVDGQRTLSAADRSNGKVCFDDFSLTRVPTLGGISSHAPPNGRHMPLRQRQFLSGLEHRCFRFFWDEMNPSNGLVPNRVPITGGPARVASIAATGFGLTALCIADEHHWEPRKAIYARVLNAMKFFRYKAPHVHGFYYHYLSMQTGKRVRHCEISSIDTSLLLAGVITVEEHFKGTTAARLAAAIYARVDWPWMLNSDFTPEGKETLSMAWYPHHGFIHYNWFQFNEGPIIYLLGIGSATHPLPPSSWDAWQRGPICHYAGYTFMTCPPLFTHQYPQAWFDLRGICDRYADYFRDSRYATVANRLMCMNLAKHFPDYGPNAWGISASLSPNGYQAWGGPPATPNIDGTIVPCAAAGSIPFAPRRCIADLMNIRNKYRGMHIYGRYGFVDAFNPLSGWVAPQLRGIDQGISLLMAENYRTGFVWRTFMKSSVAKRALRLAGFHKITAADKFAQRSSLRTK